MCRHAARRRARTDSPAASSTCGCRSISSAPHDRERRRRRRTAPWPRPRRRRAAPPSAGPSMKVAEKATFSGALASRSASCTASSPLGSDASARRPRRPPRARRARPPRAAARSRRAQRCRRAAPAAAPPAARSARAARPARSWRAASKKYRPLSSPRRGRGLHARDHGGHDERRHDLAGEQQRGDRERAVGVVEDRHRERDEAEPGAEAVDGVGADDPAQLGGDLSAERTAAS